MVILTVLTILPTIIINRLLHPIPVLVLLHPIISLVVPLHQAPLMRRLVRAMHYPRSAAGETRLAFGAEVVAVFALLYALWKRLVSTKKCI